MSEMQFVDNIRIEILNRAATALNNNDKKQAGKLMKLMDRNLSEEKYPYLKSALKNFSESLREKLKE
ncbi:hypothetical protein JNM05_02570 [bacterium]|nr:hypothetical protein [bacterium]